MEKVIELPCYGIVVTLNWPEDNPDEKIGSITDNLHEEIDFVHESEEVTDEKQKYNDMIDAMTSLILAHACAGIDIESLAYIEGIETAVDNIGNMF